jgi:isopenicillin N synthase-like dioxygenase
MNNWGHQLFRTGLTIAEMTAIGLGLEEKALSRTIENGSLYLSPPGVDLAKTKPGDVITAFHRDFTLFTVHGKSRYSGLDAWLLTGEKFLVQMPQDHLLVQGGRQLEWLTGGYLKAGFHEVIHNEVVEAQKQKNLKEGKSLWRVASTLFCHVQGDLSLRPFDHFRSP